MAIECHMWTPHVVPVLELITQLDQMVKALDNRYMCQPFVLESLDDSLCGRFEGRFEGQPFL